MIPVRIPVTLCLLAITAYATPTKWVFSGVLLSDGATINGSFVFDPDAGVRCSTGASPCGTYSSVNITTTTGGSRTGATYTRVCGTDVPSCSGVTPDSTAVLFLTSTATNQSGLPALALFFTGAGGAPPAGLTNSGGSVDISNSSLSVGAAQEAGCADSACAAPSAPSRTSTAGVVIGSIVSAPIPTLSDWCMAALGIALAAAGFVRLRRTAA